MQRANQLFTPPPTTSLQSSNAAAAAAPRLEQRSQTFDNHSTDVIRPLGVADLRRTTSLIMSSDRRAASACGFIDEEDLDAIASAQTRCLARLEKANEMMETCNALCQQRLQLFDTDVRRHILMLQTMKRDLDSVFRRIRLLKARVATRHAQEYKELLSSSSTRERAD